jgi:hypothetical protein
MRILVAFIALASVIGVSSPGAAACRTDGSITPVGTISSSAEQSTFGYTCLETAPSDVTIVQSNNLRSRGKVGADMNDPEKETYGYSASSSSKD